MLYSPLAALVFPVAVLGSPIADLQVRQGIPSPVPNITFTVTHFTAFQANPDIEGVQSNLSFHVVDSRPDSFKEADCVIPPTYFWLYAITALSEYCPSQSPERPFGFSFSFQDTYVSVQRAWTADNKTYIASSSVNPYWTEGVNLTRTSTGVLYTREEPWDFQVSTINVY